MKIILALLLFTSISNAQSLDTIWRARGLEAEEKFSKFKDQGLSKSDLCTKQIERAYSNFANPKSISYGKPDSEGRKPYTILVESSKSKQAMISFIYKKDESAPSQINVVIYDKFDENGMGIISSKDLPAGTTLLTTHECTFVFSLEKPLAPGVLPKL